MKTSTEKFYYVQHNSSTMPVKTDTFEDGALPVLWYNNGAWCLVPVAKVQNIIDSAKDQENLPVIDRRKEAGNLYWEDGVQVSAKLADILLAE